jgi:glycosyltransferase involved in cell wall biosynthesis
MRLAILGTRGIPARYGGFETFAQELSRRLVLRGHRVRVYTRKHLVPEKLREFAGVEVTLLPSLRQKHLETLSHTLLSCLHLRAREFDVVLLCNAANAPFIPLLQAKGLPVVLNVDGLERKRRKWGFWGRKYYLLCEALSARWAEVLVTDARAIQRYYRRVWRRQSVMIPYGGDLELPQTQETLRRFGLSPGGYLLYVSRFEPENNPDRVAEAYGQVPGHVPLVMVGGAPYAASLQRRLQALAASDPRIILTGPIYGQGYRELLAHALAYIHATEVGGTHPALVEAMGAGRVVFYLANRENREVAGDAGIPFTFGGSPTLAERLTAFLANPCSWQEYGEKAAARVRACYRWEQVAAAYEQVLEEACSGKAQSF